MDRPTVYSQEQGRSVDFLFAARSTMIGLGKLAQAAFGSNTAVRGLAVTPNSPAALNVLVGIGEIYSLADVDATPWGSLPADTTDVIVKQGLNMASQTISTPAPTTSGYSVAYLIECQYQDQDTNPAVLPYYNSSNPQIPLNGQGGNGAPQATQRQGFCVIQAKAGIAAPTGTQVTPSVDSGWTALAVVTVANGATTVTSGNISVPAGVPQVTSLLQMMQTGSAGYAVDTSTTANQISLSLTPAITAYTDGQEITFKAANNNTGPCTINAGGGSVNLVGAAGALQGGEIVAGKQYTALYSASLSELVLNSQTGGAEQVAPATASQHAVQFGQIAGVVGQVRNLKAILNAAGTSIPYTADEIIVEGALGGLRYCLPSFNQTLNGTTTGLGGLDTGALAANSFYAIYAAQTSAGAEGIFAQLEPVGGAPSVYGGAHLPAGVVANSLVGVWPTNASAQFIAGQQRDRRISFVDVVVLATTAGVTAVQALSVAVVVPKSAIEADVIIGLSQTVAGNGIALDVYGSAQLFDVLTAEAGSSAGTLTSINIKARIMLAVAQTLYYQMQNTTAGQYSASITGYTF